MNKYLRNLEVIFHPYSFPGSPLTLLSSYAELVPPWAFIFPPHNLMQIFYFLTPRKAIKLHSLHFKKELIKNQLRPRNSSMFFIEQKSIPLGAYFEIMHTRKVKMLSKQIYNILRNRKCPEGQYVLQLSCNFK